MFFAPTLTINADNVFNYSLRDIVNVESMEVEESAAAEPMETNEDDMLIDESSSERATSTDEAIVTMDEDMDEDEPAKEDVAMENTAEEINVSLVTLLENLDLNEEDKTTTQLNEDMASIERSGNRKRKNQQSMHGGIFWCGPPTFNIGMAPPNRPRNSRRSRR